MSNISWRHHYIPQFYLQNFTNSINMFYIYLVKENRYKANGKLFSPESHFFEEDGNTLSLEDTITDFLETSQYKKYDNTIAELFKKIKLAKDKKYGLSDKDMPLLQYFIAHLFWRNPMNNELVKELIKKNGLSGLGIQFKDRKTNEVTQNTNLEKQLMENKDYYKAIKYWLPTFLFPTLFENDSPLTIITFIPGELPSFLSDNPIILRNPNSFDIYNNDFILPLSRDKILIRTKKIKSEIQNNVRILIDLILVKQAIKFVSTTDLRYIPLLKGLSKRYESIDEIREDVFLSMVEE